MHSFLKTDASESLQSRRLNSWSWVNWIPIFCFESCRRCCCVLTIPDTVFVVIPVVWKNTFNWITCISKKISDSPRDVWSPNITGGFWDVFTTGDIVGNSSANGAFAPGYIPNNTQQTTSPMTPVSQHDGFSLSASRSSGIYNGSALQPKALSVLVCIRC